MALAVVVVRFVQPFVPFAEYSTMNPVSFDELSIHARATDVALVGKAESPEGAIGGEGVATVLPKLKTKGVSRSFEGTVSDAVENV